MLVQMPHGSGVQPDPQNAEQCSPFEASLRRDLATAPVIAYDARFGGWPKRIFDLALTTATAPFWLSALIIALAALKLYGVTQLVSRDVRMGYGGVAFRRFRLNVEAMGDGEMDGAANAVHPVPEWLHALAWLPQLFNVLRGEMSLVGPLPRTALEVDELKLGRRHYLSARPGMIGVGGVADAEEETGSSYKLYAQSWSVLTDLILVWDGLRGRERAVEAHLEPG